MWGIDGFYQFEDYSEIRRVLEPLVWQAGTRKTGAATLSDSVCSRMRQRIEVIS